MDKRKYEISAAAESREQLNRDLWIIGLVSLAALTVYMLAMNFGLGDFWQDGEIPVVLRVLAIGFFGQFGVAGMGICIVCFIRKQKFREFGLSSRNLLPALALSLLCCLPEFLCLYSMGRVGAWMPFKGVNTTAEVLASGFPSNVLGMAITALFWGFFEGFNYVVIRDKISAYSPGKYRFFDWGALVCAVMCILIHGAVGVTPEALLEMIGTFILIYGMLLVRKETGNAWGCILIFFIYWNAL